MTTPQEFIRANSVIAGNGCWNWLRQIDKYGYGKIRSKGAHRFSYVAFIAEIPDGLTIDHLCRNRACVNPWHMEPVTRRVNTLRGVGPSALHAKKTHCNKGHPLTGPNLYVVGNKRHCRACNVLRARAYKSRKLGRTK